jgi:lipoprotein signal peptidase
MLIIYAVKMRELWRRVGVGLIIVGGIGNLVSRLQYGGVLDNLSFFGLFYNNIWDWIIAVGVLVYLIQYAYGNSRNI